MTDTTAKSHPVLVFLYDVMHLSESIGFLGGLLAAYGLLGHEGDQGIYHYGAMTAIVCVWVGFIAWAARWVLGKLLSA